MNSSDKENLITEEGASAPEAPEADSAQAAADKEREIEFVAPVASDESSQKKSAPESNGEIDFVKPVTASASDKAAADEISRQIMEQATFDYVVPKTSFSDSMKHPERATSSHVGKTRVATEEEIEAAEAGFLFKMPSASKGKHHHRHHHHHHGHHHHSHHHSDHHSDHHHHHSSSSSHSDDSKPTEIAQTEDTKPAEIAPAADTKPAEIAPAADTKPAEGDSSKSSSGSSSSGSSSHGHHHHHHHHHRRRMRRWMRITLIVLGILLGIVVCVAGTFLTMKEIGRTKMHDYKGMTIVAPTEPDGDELMDVVDSGRTIVYDGKTYHFNKDVVCVALVGVDHDIENNSVQSMGDVINLVALDTRTGRLAVVSVSRDTMTDVNLYSDEGRYIDTEQLQIAYAYSFGNRTVAGGENTAVSVSRLFYGLPMNSYFSINTEALITLNDAIGGVTLKSSMDFDSLIDGRHYTKGEEVILRGRDVSQYIRLRDMDDLESNNARMDRQQEYIKAFLSQMFPAARGDFSLVSNLYNIIKVNSDTDLDMTEITYLASTALSKVKSLDDIEYYRLDGEMKKGDYAEFYADDKSVLETMLKVFYKEA